MPNGMALDAHAPAGAGVCGSAGGGPVVLMGLDQHRAQIAVEWLDTATGEVSRARIAPDSQSP